MAVCACLLPWVMLAGEVRAQLPPPEVPVPPWKGSEFLQCWANAPFNEVPVSHPDSVDIGGLLTPWLMLDVNYECDGYAPEEFEITGFKTKGLSVHLPAGVELAGIAQVLDDGQAHRVYTIPGLDGIGYIIKAQHYVQNTAADRNALNLEPGQMDDGIEFDWSFAYLPPVQSINTEPMQMAFQVALVKTGEVAQWPLPGWAQYIDFPALVHQLDLEMLVQAEGQAAEAIPAQVAEDLQFASYVLDGGDEVGTCITPSQIMSMHHVLDAAHVSEFPDTGDVAREIEFTLEWRNCLLGLVDGGFFMKYKFQVASGAASPDPLQGLLPQEDPSGAQGVAIQVLKDNSQSKPFIPGGTYIPIEFELWNRIYPAADEWESGKPVIKLPLRARYYKTATDSGADIMTPGRVEAGLRVVVQYF